MVSPFVGLITSDMKTLFTNAINALLEDDSCTLICRFIYEGTKFEDCINCLLGPSGRSANIYQDGGPIPFRSGQTCPLCGGVGKIISDSTETINMMVIWNYKEWVPMNASINVPEGSIQTLSKLATLDEIKRVNEIIVDTDIESYVKHRFQREGEPNPCGFGASSYVATIWKPVG